MTRLSWGVSGERFYETGVDRGVLYVDNAGFAWNGLISVQEKSSGGEPTPYYIDAFKYINLASSEEFEATLEAFSSPSQFNVCDGTVEILNGLSVTQQRRKAFGLSYRTKLGNDTDGVDHGYKIHIVYNALAAPSERNNQSIADSPTLTTMSWGVTTTPPLITGRQPSSHFVVSSNKVSSAILTSVENLLYGTDVVDSALPTPAALIALFV